MGSPGLYSWMGGVLISGILAIVTTVGAQSLRHIPVEPVGNGVQAVELRCDGQECLVGDHANGHRVPVGVPVARATIQGVGSSSRSRKLSILRVFRTHEDQEAEHTILLGRSSSSPSLRILWTGVTRWHGVANERTRDSIEVQNGRVVVGRETAAALCGSPPALLGARFYSPDARRWNALELPPTGLDTENAREAVVESVPRRTSLALLRPLTGSASTATHDPGTELVDGSTSTGWIPGTASRSRFAFVTMSLDAANRNVRGIQLSALEDDSLASGPASLWIRGPSGPALHASVSRRTWRQGAAFIALPEEQGWDCVSIIIDRRDSRTGPIGIAEVQAVTDLDRAGALAEVIGELDDDAKAEDAERFLRARSGSVSRPLAAALPSLSEEGQRRALQILQRAPADGWVDRRLGAFAETVSDTRLSDVLLALHGRGQVGAVSQLLPRLADETRRDLSTALAEVHGHALARLALEREGLEHTEMIQRALAPLARVSGAAVEAAIRRWAHEGPPSSSLAVVATALPRNNVFQGLRTTLVVSALQRLEDTETSFETRYRLIKASRTAAASEDIDGFLEVTAQTASEWMLRSAAIEIYGERALRSLGPDAPVARWALQFVDDATPRVRVAALNTSELTAELSTEERAQLIRLARDRWPSVRAAAWRHIVAREPAQAAVAIEDVAPAVRTMILRTIKDERLSSLSGIVGARLRDVTEVPSVRQVAAEVASALCIVSLRADLNSIMDAPDSDARVASEAHRAHGHLTSGGCEPAARRSVVETGTGTEP